MQPDIMNERVSYQHSHERRPLSILGLSLCMQFPAHILWIGLVVGIGQWNKQGRYYIYYSNNFFIMGDLLSEFEESAVSGRREIVFSRSAIQTLWYTRKCTTKSILKIKQRDCVKYKPPPHPLLHSSSSSNCNYEALTPILTILPYFLHSQKAN